MLWNLSASVPNRKVGRPRSEPTTVVRVPLALRPVIEQMASYWRDRNSAADAAVKSFSKGSEQVPSAPRKGIKVLKPADALETISALRREGITADVLILDPWYEPAPGQTISDHRQYYRRLILEGSKISTHIFCWGTANILGPLVDSAPRDFEFRDWLVWSHQNTPSVARTSWRSTHQTCLHFSTKNAPLYPERFFSAKQKRLLEQRRLRFWPSPGNVLDVGLLAGFVGANERVGHPAQKPVKVISTLLTMACPDGGLVIDPFAGSGTTGIAAMELGMRAILSDISPQYTSMMRKRLRTATSAQTKSATS